jgi:glycosyltransferase involved in cell wall biosynthesis
VVASRIPGFELLLGGGEGRLVSPPASPAAFAGVLGELLDAPGERTRLGDAARQTAVSRYSWRQVGAELESLYRELHKRGLSPFMHGRQVAATRTR